MKSWLLLNSHGKNNWMTRSSPFHWWPYLNGLPLFPSLYSPLLVKCALALWLALTNRMWQKYHSASSRHKPWESLSASVSAFWGALSCYIGSSATLLESPHGGTACRKRGLVIPASQQVQSSDDPPSEYSHTSVHHPDQPKNGPAEPGPDYRILSK